MLTWLKDVTLLILFKALFANNFAYKKQVSEQSDKVTGTCSNTTGNKACDIKIGCVFFYFKKIEKREEMQKILWVQLWNII